MKTVSQLTNEELFDELREQVNLSRNSISGHDRVRTKQISEEAAKRGWGLGKPQLRAKKGTN